MYWSFEIIEYGTDKVLYCDSGYTSESEAEYYARLDIKSHNFTNCYVRTFPSNK